uniref:Ig-like domain-containing protein n=1 Tax=Anabas testudineus TaxID=64144 RepID=A0A7N6BCL6_ANATE
FPWRLLHQRKRSEQVPDLHYVNPLPRCVSSLSASCQVAGFLEEDVLLPCVYTEEDPLPEEVSVFWRDKDDNVDQVFRGRVLSFPDRYKEGNFSISLKKLRQSDRELYECHIPKHENKTSASVLLIVNKSETESVPDCGTEPHYISNKSQPDLPSTGAARSRISRRPSEYMHTIIR